MDALSYFSSTAVRCALRVGSPSGRAGDGFRDISTSSRAAAAEGFSAARRSFRMGKEETMKYLVQWHLSEPQGVRAAAEHFLKTGGKPPRGRHANRSLVRDER